MLTWLFASWEYKWQHVLVYPLPENCIPQNWRFGSTWDHFQSLNREWLVFTVFYRGEFNVITRARAPRRKQPSLNVKLRNLYNFFPLILLKQYSYTLFLPLTPNLVHSWLVPVPSNPSNSRLTLWNLTNQPLSTKTFTTAPSGPERSEMQTTITKEGINNILPFKAIMKENIKV